MSEKVSLNKNSTEYGVESFLRLWPSWEAIEPVLPEMGEAFFFSAGGARTLWEVRYPVDTVLVFGRESVGLPRALLERHGARVLAIPMADAGLRSLNLSTAAAVA